MTADAPRTRIQQKNRSLILDAGLDIFSQAGFRGATLDQIAKAAGLSKPNLLYYFPSKEAIHSALIDELLKTWLHPLHKMDPEGDPVEEIIAYAQRKLSMSRDYPRESRLFANEIVQGAPNILDVLKGPLKDQVEEKAGLIRGWIEAGRIAPVDPFHLIFSIWALTQHYADFDVQVRAVLGHDDPWDDAAAHLDQLFRRLLSPD